MIDNLRAAKSHADILLLGDFNIDLLKPHSSWDSTITLLGLTQLIESPTRITPTSATLIDHIYTNNPDAFTDVSVSDLSISDHCPISCTKFVKLSKCKLKTHSLISFRSFKHFNKTACCADLNCAPFISVLNYTDPEEALSVWYNVYLSVINRHAPLKHKRVKHPKLPPWLNKDVMQLMAERDKLKKEKRFSEYKKLRDKIKNRVRKAKKDYFQKLIERDKNISTVWRALNIFTKGSQSHSADIPKNLTADTFNNHFLSVAECLIKPRSDDVYDSECSNILHEFCERKTRGQEPFVIPYISIPELGKYVSKLDNKKSSGPDGISNHLLKLSLPYIIDSLTYIFNLCIKKNHYPSEFKKAKVIPLPKTRDKTNLTDYRPISLLSVLSKLLEKHVHVQLNDYLEKHLLIHPFQSGFRCKHSCSTALVRLTHSWLTAMNRSEVSGVIFLDLKKAFDLVDHNIMMYKLGCYLQNSSSLPFFKPYLEGRTQSVFLRGSYSSEGSVKFGVPQGSVLGPILFSIFINDLPLHVTNISVACDILADDTTLHTSGKDIMQVEHTLQESLDQVSCWCDNNSMVINPKKTHSMTIAIRQKHQLLPLSLDLILHGVKVEQVAEHRPLGLIIDNKLRWDTHTDTLCKTLSKRVFLLSKLKYIVDTDTLKLFFNAHVKSHIDYASVVWGGCSDALKKRLNFLLRRSGKLILPDKNLTTDQKLNKIGILNLHKQLDYSKGVFMYRALTNSAPVYISSLYKAPHSSSRNNYLQLPKPRIDLFKTSMAFSGALFWNCLPVHLRSCHSLSSFKRNLREHLNTTA